MATNRSVSLVVPVYNGWEYLRSLLACLSDSDHNHFQVILVDDASPDDQIDLVAESFPRVTVIKHEINRGFAGAVNTGLSAVRSDVAVILNSDLTFRPVDLQKLAEFARVHSPCIIAPRNFRPSGSPIRTAHTFPTVNSMLLEFLPLYRVARKFSYPAITNSRESGAGLMRCDWVLGACMALSLDTFHKLGPLDESYGMYSEEIDWQRRAADLGIGRFLLRDVRVTHDESHGASASQEAVTRRHKAIWTARIRYIRKFRGEFEEAKFKRRLVVFSRLAIPIWLAAKLLPVLKDQAEAELDRHRQAVALAK